MVNNQVLVHLPLKQGLRHNVSFMVNEIYHKVLVHLPLKQGLRL